MTLYERSKALQRVKTRELLREFDHVFSGIETLFLYPEVTALKILILPGYEKLSIYCPYNTYMRDIEFSDIPNIVSKYRFKSVDDEEDFERDFMYYLNFNTDFEFEVDEIGDTVIKVPISLLF